MFIQPSKIVTGDILPELPKASIKPSAPLNERCRPVPGKSSMCSYG
jgi:hypothetical protein